MGVRSIGTGAVGLHDAKPIIRKRTDLCADYGHPGVKGGAPCR